MFIKYFVCPLFLIRSGMTLSLFPCRWWNVQHSNSNPKTFRKATRSISLAGDGFGVASFVVELIYIPFPLFVCSGSGFFLMRQTKVGVIAGSCRVAGKIFGVVAFALGDDKYGKLISSCYRVASVFSTILSSTSGCGFGSGSRSSSVYGVLFDSCFDATLLFLAWMVASGVVSTTGVGS